jgi:MurNAc alpha-1-phosphate uridylyltransferase
MADRFRPDVMLLAAGLGTRMRPLTDSRPKPLVEVGGTALIDRVIANARDEGLDRFVANTHHFAEQIEAHLAGRPGFTLSHEPDGPLGTGGGIKHALPLLTTDPILVMNTDAFWLAGRDRPIARMLERWERGGARMVLLCVHPRDARGFRRSHDFCLDPGGRITWDAGAPVIYTGVMLLARSVFDGAPEGAFSLGDILLRLGQQGDIAGVILDATWLHVGDVEGIAEAEAVLR